MVLYSAMKFDYARFKSQVLDRELEQPDQYESAIDKLKGDFAARVKSAIAPTSGRLPLSAWAVRQALAGVTLGESQQQIENRAQSLTDTLRASDQIISISRDRIELALDVACNQLNLPTTEAHKLANIFETIRLTLDFEPLLTGYCSQLKVSEEEFKAAYDSFYEIVDGTHRRKLESASQLNPTTPEQQRLNQAASDALTHSKLKFNGFKNKTYFSNASSKEAQNLKESILRNKGQNFVDENTPIDIAYLSCASEQRDDSILAFRQLKFSPNAIVFFEGSPHEVMQFMLDTFEPQSYYRAAGLTDQEKLIKLFHNNKGDDAAEIATRANHLSSPYFDPSVDVSDITYQIGILTGAIFANNLNTRVLEKNSSSIFNGPRETGFESQKSASKQVSGIKVPKKWKQLLPFLATYSCDLFSNGISISELISAKELPNKSIVSVRVAPPQTSDVQTGYGLSRFFAKFARAAKDIADNELTVVAFSNQESWHNGLARVRRKDATTIGPTHQLSIVARGPRRSFEEIKTIRATHLFEAILLYAKSHTPNINAMLNVIERIGHSPEYRRQVILDEFSNAFSLDVAEHLAKNIPLEDLTKEKLRDLSIVVNARQARIATQLITLNPEAAFEAAKSIISNEPQLLTLPYEKFKARLLELRQFYVAPEPIIIEEPIKIIHRNLQPSAEKPAQVRTTPTTPAITAEEIRDSLTKLFIFNSAEAENITDVLVKKQQLPIDIVNQLTEACDGNQNLAIKILEDSSVWIDPGFIREIESRIKTVKFLIADFTTSTSSKLIINEIVGSKNSCIRLKDPAEFQDYISSIQSLADEARRTATDLQIDVSAQPLMMCSQLGIAHLISKMQLNYEPAAEELSIGDIRENSESLSQVLKRSGRISSENTFFDRDSHDAIFATRSPNLPSSYQKEVEALLKVMHSAKSLSELNRGKFRLHHLTGNSLVRYAISTPGMKQYRICFNWNKNTISDIWIGDYHDNQMRRAIEGKI